MGVMVDIIRILYVDDKPDLLELGTIYLQKSGDFSVTAVDSAQEALALLQSSPFDAIISDYQMPLMDGIDFLSEVRKKHGQVPFILFTEKGRASLRGSPT
jgi:CheY-like chemotaxis protein